MPNVVKKQFPDPPANLHLIGLKGVAMTALAEILQGQGYTVVGSDTSEVFPTDKVLKNLNIHSVNGFSAENVGPDTAAIIYSTAYFPDHIERRTARERGISEWSYPEAVGLLFEVYHQSIAVAGSHGKTTTTAMLARILEEGGLDPTAIVGSTVADWGRNARLGSSPWFVLEADEYQNKFQFYSPRHLVVLNVDYDHPDYFSTRKAYAQVFLDFAAKLPPDGVLALWGEEPLAADISRACRAHVVTFGRASSNDWQLANVGVGEMGTSFTVRRQGEVFGDFLVPFPGEHYALNAMAALTMAVETAGVGVETIARALKLFRGTARRLEHKGEWHGAILLDDYAHHPTEVAVTLRALRARYGERRLWCVFQSHTFSRTAAFLKEFVDALGLADRVILPPIYASAREQAGAVTSDHLVRLINERFPGKAKAVPNHEAAAEQLRTSIAPGDVVVTMGAGDVWRVVELLGE